MGSATSMTCECLFHSACSLTCSSVLGILDLLRWAPPLVMFALLMFVEYILACYTSMLMSIMAMASKRPSTPRTG